MSSQGEQILKQRTSEEPQREELQHAPEEKQRALEEQQRALEEQQNLLKEQQNAPKGRQRTPEEKQRALKEQQHLLEEQQRLLEEQQHLLKEQQYLLKEQQRPMKEQLIVMNERQRLQNKKEHLWLQHKLLSEELQRPPGEREFSMEEARHWPEEKQILLQQRLYASELAHQRQKDAQDAQRMATGSQTGDTHQMAVMEDTFPATDPSDIYIRTGIGRSPPSYDTFLCACREGDLSAVESIVTAQTRSQSFLHRGLQEAVKNGKVDVSRYLIQSGAPTTRHTPESVLGAPADQQVGLFQLLQEHGWIVDTPESLLPRLMYANNGPVIDWFLEHGADPNLGGHPNWPEEAMAIAASQGTVELVQKLLNAGAKMNRGGLGLYFAAGSIPRTAGSFVDPRLVEQTTEFDKSRIPVMALLVENGASVNDKWETRHVTNQYPIVAAVKVGAVERVKWLLSQGADPDLKGQYGSARDCAKYKSSDEMKQVLGVQ